MDPRPDSASDSRPILSSAHVVQVFETEAALCASLTAFVRSALNQGEGFILIARGERLHVYIDRLLNDGFDVETHVTDGRILLLDARDLLTREQRRGEFNSLKLSEVIEKQIASMRENFKNVRIYSEMADHLIELGFLDEALELERVCEHAAQAQQATILCTYDAAKVGGSVQPPLLKELLACHTHVIDSDLELQATLLEATLKKHEFFQA